MSVTVWKPLACLQKNSDCKVALMLLNEAEPENRKLFDVLWKKAQFRMTVDGGTNHLYDVYAEDINTYLPDLITGDFDSIRPAVKNYYMEKNVEVMETPDQDNTDFTKALKCLSLKIKDKKTDVIAVLGSFGGRFDHVFANVNTLFEARNITDVPVMLYSQDTVSFLLHPGSHKILVDPLTCGEWCGLIPIGEPCNNVTTQGLKWNLDKQKLSFGELISTSNTLESVSTEAVVIETDKPLLWTMGVVSSKTGEHRKQLFHIVLCTYHLDEIQLDGKINRMSSCINNKEIDIYIKP